MGKARPIKTPKRAAVHATVTPEAVMRIAHAAHLMLTVDELKRFARDLNDILDAFAVLDTADRSEASFQPLDIRNVMHDDVPEQCLSQDEALANTEHKEKGFFKGPRAV